MLICYTGFEKAQKRPRKHEIIAKKALIFLKNFENISSYFAENAKSCTLMYHFLSAGALPACLFRCNTAVCSEMLTGAHKSDLHKESAPETGADFYAPYAALYRI